MSGLQRTSLTSCALLLSLSTVAYANPETTDTVDYEKSYTLTPVEAAGTNTITKYEYNIDTGKLEPKYYDFKLNKTEYGEGNNSQTFTLSRTPVKDVEITVKYDTPSSDTSSGNYTNIYKDVNFKLEETNPGGTYSNHYQAIGGAIKDADFSNSVLFENNTVDAVLNVSGGTSYSNRVQEYMDVLVGALYNDSKIDSIVGAFVNNSIKETINIEGSSSYNSGSIYTYGGALYNKGTIGSITADFINNSADYGSAIYNAENASIGDITGDFIGNTGNTSNHGSAIYNKNAQIGNITGDFINNNNKGIHNDNGTIGDITGSFLGNTGEGIYSYNGTIDDITGDFINNRERGIYSYNGTIGNITGNFIGNGNRGIYIEGSSSITGSIIGDFIKNSSEGLYNDGSITFVKGNFINNALTGLYNSSTGTINSVTGDFIANYSGGLHNGGTITSITGDFIANVDENNDEGGALYNSGSIGNITGDFLSNRTYGYTSLDKFDNGSVSCYGNLYNGGGGSIDSIIGNFIDNTLELDISRSSSGSDESDDYNGYGGAIANRGDITLIQGDFISNKIFSPSDDDDGDGGVFGGAIANTSSISNIKGNFVNNSIYGSDDYKAYGGAIYNRDYIGTIEGKFANNNVYSEEDDGYGGAIANYSSTIYVKDNRGNEHIDGYESSYIESIKGDFYQNSASAGEKNAKGGAIYNHTGSTIDSIEGNFQENSAVAENYKAYGGAIDNVFEIGTIKGTFTGNFAKAEDDASGGAIYNYSTGHINEVTGDFIQNYVLAGTGENTAEGGAVHNDAGILTKLTGNFSKNYAEADEGKAKGGALYNYGKIEEVSGSFSKNYTHTKTSEAVGGAIFNDGVYTGDDGYYDDGEDFPATINKITADFVGNEARSDSGKAYGGAIHNSKEGELGEITGSFGQNAAIAGDTARGGAIYNKSHIASVTGEFVENRAESKTGSAQGGAIYNEAELDNIVNSSFVGNSAKSESGSAKGGAIYSKGGVINIAATRGYVSRFEGNYTDNGGKIEDNAIYLDTSDLNFNMETGGQIVMKDSINGKDYKVNITGDNIDDTRFYLHNDMKNADLSLANTTIDTIDNSIHTYNVKNLTIGQDTKMVADVDLMNSEMDRFTSDSYGSHNGNLIVSGMNLISDAPEDRKITEIYFAQPGLKDNVVNGTAELPDGSQTSFYTPIYKYNAMYDNRDDGGYFMFTKGDRIFTPGGGTTSTGNPSDAFNPAVLSTGVAAQAGAYATQMNTFHYAFQHLDNFMNLPYMERLALKNQNRYALTSSTESGIFSPTYAESLGASYWIKPYVSFESIPLNNGPKVDNINYGTLIGFDSEMKPIAHGFDRVLSGYVGYNGASQSYSGVDTYQNGGLLGGTMFLYKGNFFNATTLSVGASLGETHNMYGTEDFTMLLAGLGNRLGYNFEFKNGKYIIQPSMLMSYTFVNTFDYTNSAGLNVESDPMHVIQLSPGVKFIMNTKNGWQPYATVNMVWNILNKSSVTANSVRLPEMSVDPYVQYGVGIQKRIKDKFVAFGQALVSNGGRNGVSLTFGLRWFLGKE